ncbi:hypothetical protein ACK0UW_28675, partial [Bacillus anthracis]|uniref:hypothetical protein n=1 Tax=Bacillus anthracis TaxID=1392 RepID=UPI003904ABF7
PGQKVNIKIHCNSLKDFKKYFFLVLERKREKNIKEDVMEKKGKEKERGEEGEGKGGRKEKKGRAGVIIVSSEAEGAGNRPNTLFKKSI